MKIIVQRVTRCSVSVNGEVISSIGNGMFVLVGIAESDSDADLNYMIKRILKMRLFDEGRKKWCKNVVDKDLEVLCVSQFTLCYKFKGNKLDFRQAMPTEKAKCFFEKFLKKLKLSYKPDKVKEGKFGAYMSVDLCNDGPVTIELSSNLDVQTDQTKEKP